ncbi:MAG: glycoside hydrolase family 18 protein [Myxococcales bacterium]|nr:glycoside hydrolase family 18 protein [Myxococcales bacterium]
MPLVLLSAVALADTPHDGPAAIPGLVHEWKPHATVLPQRPNPNQRAGTYTQLRASNDRPSVTVYGYWPYWTDPLSTMPWDQLTHIAIFDINTDASGNLTNTTHWTSNAANAVALAAPHNVKVHLCLTSFDDVVMNSVLSSASNRSRLVTNLRNQVNAYGADGVNIDFEGLDAPQKANFVSFLQELSAQVDEVYVAMPAVDWNGSYDYDQIAFATDGLFVMGYDYYWSGGNPGPVSPLYGSARWGTYSLDWSLTDYRTWGAPDASIVMGLPLYGQNWPTTNNNVPGTRTANASSVTFGQATIDYTNYTRHYDTQGDSPYAFRTATSQEWVDDAESVETKADWAVAQNIQGIGFWAMGYDDADVDLWSRLDTISHQGGMQVTVSPGVAGQVNTFSVTGGPANRNVRLAYGGNASGTTAIPGCSNSVQIQGAGVLGSANTDAQGRATFQVNVPGNYSGVTGRFQAVIPSNCQVSSVLIDRF